MKHHQQLSSQAVTIPNKYMYFAAVNGVLEEHVDEGKTQGDTTGAIERDCVDGPVLQKLCNRAAIME